MLVRIHRGTREIGGTCVELAANGARLLLDLGLPLGADAADTSLHPNITDNDNAGELVGLVLSHGHRDHVGLAHLAGPTLPVVMGKATRAIWLAAAPFVPGPVPAFLSESDPSDAVPERPAAPRLEHGVPLQFGPFTITPHLVDHSGFDAYALTVEAEGQRLFYSGDLRAHGRKGALFERLVRDPPRSIDVMLMEGSSFGRLDPDGVFPSEADIEAALAGALRACDGLALVAASAQNIDRMVSLYRACKRSGRTLIIDLYAAEVLAATGNPNIPRSDWSQMAVYVPQHQRVQIKRSGRFDILDRHSANRIFPEQLAALAPRAALLFRASLLSDLDRAGCLAGANAIWSQWSGYLDEPRGQDLRAALATRGIRLTQIHTSGHASIRDLKRLAAAVNPRRLVPIHTFHPEAYEQHFANVAPKNDGEWWEMAA